MMQSDVAIDNPVIDSSVIGSLMIDKPISELKASLPIAPEKKESCIIFPYDNSNSPCNLLGWQSFAYQSLTHTKREHQVALLSSSQLSSYYKQLILMSHHFEEREVRAQAVTAMFNISRAYSDSFGHFFYILATYTEQHLINENNAEQLKSKLKKTNKKNAQLASELKDAQSKIQAIMDIEKNLKTD